MALSLFSCNDNGESIFTDEIYNDTIKQNLGGSLIRVIHHSNDHHSFNYDIHTLTKTRSIKRTALALAAIMHKSLPKTNK
jgi:hypothetical protein